MLAGLTAGAFVALASLAAHAGDAPPNAVNLDAVADRIVTGTCRLVVVGDSITQVTGAPPHGSRFAHGILRNWKPDHWIGCDTAVNSYFLGGTWVANRPTLPGILTWRSPGQQVQPGFSNPYARFAETTPLGFHLNWLHVASISPSAGAETVQRVTIGAGGEFLATSWRDRVGAHRLLEPGAHFAFTPYWYTPRDDAQGGRTFVDAVEPYLESPSDAFAWSDETLELASVALADGAVDMHFGRVAGTLVDAPKDIDAAALAPGSGPGIGIRAPGDATWGSQVGPLGGRLLLGGCSIERVDTPEGRGLWVGTIANGGWRATNHRWEPQDEYEPDAFGTEYFANYRDDALRAYLERFRVDTVMVILGVNDSGMGGVDGTPVRFRANVEAILSRYRQAHAIARASDPTIQPLRFLLVAPVASIDNADRRARLAEYADRLRSAAGNDVAFIDLHGLWQTTFGEYDDWSGEYLSDGTHPNLAGQDVMSSMLWTEILEAFEHRGETSIADLDNNGVVNGEDLITLLGNWGGSGVGDIDESGVVDGADLSILLTEWD